MTTAPSDTPLVSVVVPTHNRASLLRRAIDSVIAQTYSRWECIIVDDASTDGTEDDVQQYADARIRYMRLPTNQGQCAARNHGIRIANGSYVAFLDSDDEWLPGKLQAQLALFNADTSGQLGVVMCGVIKISETSGVEMSRKIPNLGRRPWKELLDLRDNPPTYTLLVRRECFDHDLWDEQLPHRTDWDLCIRIARKYAFGVVQQYLVKAYQHDGPRTSRPEQPWSGWEYCIEKYRSDLRTHPKSLARHHYFAFRSYYSAGAFAGARRHLLLAVWYDPWRPGRWIALGGLLLGRRTSEALVNAYESLKRTTIRNPKANPHTDRAELRANS